MLNAPFPYPRTTGDTPDIWLVMARSRFPSALKSAVSTADIGMLNALANTADDGVKVPLPFPNRITAASLLISPTTNPR